MRTTLLAMLLAMSACQTKSPTAGCTKENCHLMNDCRIGTQAWGFPKTCGEYAGDAGDPNIHDRIDAYCVDACTGTRSGERLECIAKAPECTPERDDDYPTTFPDCQAGADAPESSCEQACASKKFECDARCSGGDACDACRHGGQPDCTAVCPAKSRMACIDCSEACLPAYFACADACPRANN